MSSNFYNHILILVILLHTLVTFHYNHTKPVQVSISPVEDENYCYVTACDVLNKIQEKIPLFFDNQTSKYSSSTLSSNEQDYEINNVNFKDTQETRLIKLERRLRSVEQTGM
jgi:hypothetical protein